MWPSSRDIALYLTAASGILSCFPTKCQLPFHVPRKKRGAMVLHILLGWIWHLGTHWISLALKAFIGDSRCNKNANSISGHAAFFTSFVLLSYNALCVVIERWRTHRNPRRFTESLAPLALLVTAAFYVAVASISLCVTFFGGYHTLRQMLFGVVLGAVSHVAVSTIIDASVFAKAEAPRPGLPKDASSTPQAGSMETILHHPLPRAAIGAAVVFAFAAVAATYQRWVPGAIPLARSEALACAALALATAVTVVVHGHLARRRTLSEGASNPDDPAESDGETTVSVGTQAHLD